MNLQLFFAAPLVVQLHATAAIAAFFLGLFQLATRKGNARHRTLGWIWVGLMYAAATTSLFINQNPWLGPFSPIHLLSVLVIFGTPASILAARRGNIARHKAGMIQLYVFGIIVAGSFAALAPGRLLHDMLFV